MPTIDWDAKNQAAVHTWYTAKFGYPVEPLTSIEDAVATWPETATAVAVRLLPDDSLRVVAPLGLGDLLGMVLRRNPRRVTAEDFRQRLERKRPFERWPRVTILDE
ncbi:MAG: nucleotidyltransferase family protein [Gaiellaceae bacterium]